jgi:hypothetical protein
MSCCARIASICGREPWHDDEMHAQAVQQVEVVDDAEERVAATTSPRTQ